MSDMVKVYVDVSMSGGWSGEVTMSRENFELLDSMNDTELARNLGDYVKWSEVDMSPDECDDFRIIEDE
jgi:hypothetical protein